MPKRIEFIAPVEAMRGNLSGAQKLVYAENDNPAYDGPVGSVNYARNYSPRFVGAKIASSGKKYFTVRTKSASHLTLKAKKGMALMGGTGAIVASILRQKTATPYNNIMAQYIELQQLGENRTFRKYVSDIVRQALATHAANIVFAGPRPTYSIKNPWNDASMTEGAEVSQRILVKFWEELAVNGIYFTVDGKTGIGISSETWDDLIQSEDMNILGLTSHTDDGQTYLAATDGGTEPVYYVMDGQGHKFLTSGNMSRGAFVLTPIE